MCLPHVYPILWNLLQCKLLSFINQVPSIKQFILNFLMHLNSFNAFTFPLIKCGPTGTSPAVQLPNKNWTAKSQSVTILFEKWSLTILIIEYC